MARPGHAMEYNIYEYTYMNTFGFIYSKHININIIHGKWVNFRIRFAIK